MLPLSLQTLTEFTHGTLHGGDGSRMVTTISTDSRNIPTGSAFVALVGDRFDGHDFAAAAAEVGAAAIIVSKPVDVHGCAVIVVKDTLVALQNLAANYRAHHNPHVIGLTGSNGKTSTKDLTAAVLSQRFQVQATLGNLNNHIGVPLTLLSLNEGTNCAVVEMGMNHAGEIRALVDIAKPDAAIVTNIGHAHIEFLGSRDNIAWEKATLPTQIAPTGTVVLNANDPYTERIRRMCQAAVFTAGIDCGDVVAHALKPDSQGTRFVLEIEGRKMDAHLPVIGRHMVLNAALAACMGWRSGITLEAITDALCTARVSGGRLQIKWIGGIQFIDDSYNANPDSMEAALHALIGATGNRRYAVLGAMGELGAFAESGHDQIGKTAAKLNLAGLFTIGDAHAKRITDAAGQNGAAFDLIHFPDHASCAAHLRELLQEGDTVLLKGSRTSSIEKVISHFVTP